MSFKVVDHVLDYSDAEGTDRLVLIVIGEAAREPDFESYQGVDTIARRSRVSRRTVFRSIKRLEEIGEMTVAYKAGPNGCNRYCVKPLLEKARQLRLAEDRAIEDTVPSGHGAAGGSETVTPVVADRATGVTRTIGTRSKPEVDPPKSPAENPEVLAILVELAEEKGTATPTAASIDATVRDFPDRDHAGVARDLKHWATHGKGAARRNMRVASTYRNFVKKADRVTLTAARKDWPAWVARELPDLQGIAATMAVQTAQMFAGGGHEVTVEKVRAKLGILEEAA